MNKAIIGIAALALCAISSTANAQRYFARQPVAPKASTATQPPAPAPTYKATCGTIASSQTLNAWGDIKGAATTPFVANGGWQSAAVALCRNFEYGGPGRCTAYHTAGSTVVEVYGYLASQSTVSPKPGHLADSIVMACSPS